MQARCVRHQVTSVLLIGRADQATLERWTDRILTAPSLNDVLA
jgi:hypothetical protein